MKYFLILCSLLSSYLTCAQGEVLWTTVLSTSTGTSDLGDKDLKTDDSGNSYFTATYKGLISNSGVSLSSGSSNNVVIGKVDPNGNLLWAKQLTGSADEYVYAITLDAANNVLITGSFATTLAFEGTSLASGTSVQKMYVLKLDNSGNYVWHWTPGTMSGSSVGYDLETDSQSNIYVVGSFTGNSLQVGSGTLTNTQPGSKESGLVIKLGTTGNVVWSEYFQGTYSTTYPAIEVTGTDYREITRAGFDQFYLAGNFRQSAVFADTTLTTVSGDQQYQDAFVAKIDSSGDYLWRKSFGIMNASSYDGKVVILTMETVSGNDVILAGTFGGSNTGMNLMIGANSFTNGWNEDIFYARFTPSGSISWGRSVVGPNNPDIPQDLAVSNMNEFAISSTMSQTNTFSDTVVTHFMPYNLSTFICESAAGTFERWFPSYPCGTVLNGFPAQIAFDPLSNRYTFGMKKNGSGNADGLYISKRSSGAILIQGDVFEDTNFNAVFDSLEIPVPHVLIKGDNGMFYKSSDLLGRYEVQLDSSDHSFEVFPPEYWYSFNPATGIRTTSIPYLNDTISNTSFALAMYPDIIDLRIDLTAGPLRPGFDGNLFITCKNIGTEPSYNNLIELNHSDTLVYVSSSVIPVNYSAQTLVWEIDTLNVGEERTIHVLVNVPPDVNLLGEFVQNRITITPELSDTNMVNNSDTLNSLIVGAYDPNFKKVTPEGIGSEGYITSDNTLEYEIHFQNTGTDTAFTVVLVDTISANLDLTSFTTIGASHLYDYSIDGPGIVTWTFSDIMLPDSAANPEASQGFIKYQIRTTPGLAQGTRIDNLANIYFDYNPPITTNAVRNTIRDCNFPSDSVSYQICPGDSVLIYGVYQKVSGIYFDTLQSVYGCDSILKSVVSVLSAQITDNSTQYICNGDSLFLYNQYISASGEYFDTLQNQFGCDSILKTTLVLLSDDLIFDTLYSICEGDSILLYNHYQNLPGVYYDTLQNLSGCDSIRYSNLTVTNCLGIPENPNSRISIHPNPGSGQYVIMLGVSEPLELNIYSSNFQLIRSESISSGLSYDLNMEGEAPGVYLLEFTSQEGVRILRRIVQI